LLLLLLLSQLLLLSSLLPPILLLPPIIRGLLAFSALALFATCVYVLPLKLLEWLQ
jgi:hypothetical protein